MNDIEMPHLILTKPQRRALYAVYCRGPLIKREIFFVTPAKGLDHPYERVTYKEFRRAVRPLFHDPCILIPWQGMWLGIEPDGYTHS